MNFTPGAKKSMQKTDAENSLPTYVFKKSRTTLQPEIP